MNIDDKHRLGSNKSDPFDREARREWELQERALHEPRPGLVASAGDAALADYRRIASALRTPLPPVPEDFATEVARTARANRVASAASLERNLLRGLFVVFALSALVVATYLGGDWLRAMSALSARLPAAASQWLSLLAACTVLSWLLQHLRPVMRLPPVLR